MLVSLNNIYKTFGDKVILNELNATIEDNDRIGLIGANGIGKSTLLNIICGKLQADGGELSVTSSKRIGILEQNSGLDRTNTIYPEMKSVFSKLLEVESELRSLEAEIASFKEHDDEYHKKCEEYSKKTAFFEIQGGYEIDLKIKTILNGMGFMDKSYDMSIASLSGGEKTRLALAKLLLESPDLLILDEPTNHLDFKTLMWLEDYLSGYKGGLLVVSHDRYFLDKMVTKMWELQDKKVVSYNGNYSKYKVLRAERMERLTKEYQTQQNKIASMREFAEKNIARASTSNMAKSRLHQIENMEILECPTDTIHTPHFNFTFERNPVKDVLFVKDLKLTVGEGEDKITLCENISFNIQRGDKIALIGPNGIGKSTLLKAVLGQLPQQGEINWGANVFTGYYEQENLTLNRENTAIEELWGRFPLMSQTDVRSMLGQVLITGDNAFKKVGILSGGERARVALAVIMAEHKNTLLLDEPTNHLDLQSKEELEKSLVAFEGTLMFVSHDRYFLNAIPNKIIELNKRGLTVYNGNFDFYLEESAKLARRALEEKQATLSAEKKLDDEKPSYRSKQERAEQTKLRARVKRLENEIELLDDDITTLEEQIASPEVASDYTRLSDLCAELEGKKQLHEKLFLEWSEICE